MENDDMEHIVMTAGRGAELANEHYLETGHKIIVLGKKQGFYISDGSRRFMDFTKEYKCTQCDFRSFRGVRKSKD